MNVEHEPVGDPRLGAAWREYSHETPPAHLDQAIVAAAHRAVGSLPQDSVAPAATRPQRWWMPLAAAAAIGAMAVGVLQVTPPQELVVAPPVHEAASPSTSARDAAHVAKVRKAGQDAQTSQQNATATPPSDSVAARALTRERSDAQRKLERDADRSVERGPRRREVPAVRSPAGDEQRTAESDPVAKDHAPAVAKSLARGNIAVAPAPAPMLAPPSVAAPAPFPTPSSAAAPQAAPVLAPPPTPSSAAAPTETYAAPPFGRIASAPQRQQSTRGQLRESDASGAAASRTESPLVAKTSLTPEEVRARANDPDAWIARIRRLRDEGQTVAAVRELAAFRATVADAERRVPSDLREWAAAVGR